MLPVNTKDINTQLPQKTFIYQVPKQQLSEDQKLILSNIISTITQDKTKDLRIAIRQPSIQKHLKSQFQMTENEIQGVQNQILEYCQELVQNAAKRKRPQSSFSVKSSARQQQPLSILQKKELDHFESLTYHQFPAQPCVQSLYHIAKIGEGQRIIVPPTILIGFNYDNKLLYNDQKTGLLKVKSGYISPKIVSNFISDYMTKDISQQSVKDVLLFPKFIIKIASKNSNQNNVRLYYCKEALMSDILEFWGNFDFAVQSFIKQKYPRPYIYRYYLKNGHVYKAMSISNQENINEDTKLYKDILNLIKDQREQGRVKIRPRSEYLRSERRVGILNQKLSKAKIKQIVEQYENSSSPKLQRIIDDSKEDYAADFPTSLKNFNLNTLFNNYQAGIKNDDFRKYFIVSTENVDNLSMMNCRPSCQPLAEQMILDLQRMFAQYYLQIKKFGNISSFVCDFMEDENGICYLLQVKSFECEGIKYDWQIIKTPSKNSISNPPMKESDILKQQETDLLTKCEAKILCKDSHFEELRQMLKKGLKENGDWKFSHQVGTIPKVQNRLVKKYCFELDNAREEFFFYQRQKLCPFLPLTSFNQNRNHQQESKIQELNKTLEQEKNTISEIPSCLFCFKLIELFQNRNMALIFKSDKTKEELLRLKFKLYTAWNQSDIEYILKLYKECGQTLTIISDIEQKEKKQNIKILQERAKSPESVTTRNTKNSFINSVSFSHCQSNRLLKKNRKQMDGNLALIIEDVYNQQAPDHIKIRPYSNKEKYRVSDTFKKQRKSGSVKNYIKLNRDSVSYIFASKKQSYNKLPSTYDLVQSEMQDLYKQNLFTPSGLKGEERYNSSQKKKIVDDDHPYLASSSKKKLNGVNEQELGQVINQYNIKVINKDMKKLRSERNFIQSFAIEKSQDKDSYLSYFNSQKSHQNLKRSIGKQNSFSFLQKNKILKKSVNQYFNIKRAIKLSQEKMELASNIRILYPDHQ